MSVIFFIEHRDNIVALIIIKRGDVASADIHVCLFPPPTVLIVPISLRGNAIISSAYIVDTV